MSYLSVFKYLRSMVYNDNPGMIQVIECHNSVLQAIFYLTLYSNKLFFLNFGIEEQGTLRAGDAMTCVKEKIGPCGVP